MKRLLIVGAGGFARETAAAAVAAGWQVLGFLDDDPALHGCLRAGLPVLGPCAAVDEHPDVPVVVSVGNPHNFTARAGLVDRLGLATRRYATVVHPSAEIGAGSRIGPGSVLLAGVVLTTGVTVGAHVAVMPQVVLTHDNRVDDYATLASGVRLGGGVVVEEGAYLGAGALVREGVTVGAWSLTGMGSVVLRDVPATETWAGNPAGPLRAPAAAATPRS